LEDDILNLFNSERSVLNKSFWLEMAVKLFLTMSLLIAIMTYSSEIGYDWFHSSTLIVLHGSMYPVPEAYPGFATPYIGVITGVLILCLPGLTFNYWIAKQARERSIKRQLLGHHGVQSYSSANFQLVKCLIIRSDENSILTLLRGVSNGQKLLAETDS
jgi:hypothetical protein